MRLQLRTRATNWTLSAQRLEHPNMGEAIGEEVVARHRLALAHTAPLHQCARTRLLGG